MITDGTDTMRSFFAGQTCSKFDLCLLYVIWLKPLSLAGDETVKVSVICDMPSHHIGGAILAAC